MNTKRRSLLVITAQVSRPSGPGLGIRLRKIGKIQWLPLLPHFLTKLGEPLTSEKKNIGSARKVQLGQDETIRACAIAVVSLLDRAKGSSFFS